MTDDSENVGAEVKMGLSELFAHIAAALGPVRQHMSIFDDEKAQMDKAIVALRDAEANLDAYVQAQVDKAVGKAIEEGLTAFTTMHENAYAALEARLKTAEDAIAGLQGDEAEITNGLASLDTELTGEGTVAEIAPIEPAPEPAPAADLHGETDAPVAPVEEPAPAPIEEAPPVEEPAPAPVEEAPAPEAPPAEPVEEAPPATEPQEAPEPVPAADVAADTVEAAPDAPAPASEPGPDSVAPDTADPL